MTAAEVEALSDLYETDETAWLDAMAELAAQRRVAEMDYEHLAEYLTDMARRDRREVRSRLVVLTTHLLKWDYQPKKWSRSWRLTIANQRMELKQALDSKSLRRHAQDVLAAAYDDSVNLAAIETGLPKTAFPSSCPYDVTQIEQMPLDGEPSNGRSS